ncbi:MAG: hypothetical protein K6F50_09150 [Kiritimatiellae bacterium]|nr:hypothetical protein [Kiritimatiellia bacterium]
MKRAVFSIVAALLSAGLFAGRPVARWDVVPYQQIDGTFRIGVVAFHEHGVQVEFSVNGKKAWTAKRASLNKRTGVVEHCFPLKTEKYADGPVTVTAVAVTDGEEKYELAPLTLYVDRGGKLGSKKSSYVDPVNGNDFAPGTKDQPVQSLKLGVQRAGDGGTVYLLPGKHDLKLTGGGLERTYWTTLKRAPGVGRDEVEILGGRSGTDKLKFVDLNMTCEAGPGDFRVVADGEGGKTSAWFDGCSFSNVTGRETGHTKPFGNGLRAYVTGGTTQNMTDGPNGELVRGHAISNISGEAFGGGGFLAVDCTVDNVDAEGTETIEAFLYQGFEQPPRWVSDAILYNIRAMGCIGRCFSGRQLRDSAFVNIAFRGPGNDLCTTKFALGLENVIFARVRIEGQNWEWVKQVSMRENVKPKEVRLFDVKAGMFSGYGTTDGSEGLTVEKECDIISFPLKQRKERK